MHDVRSTIDQDSMLFPAVAPRIGEAGVYEICVLTGVMTLPYKVFGCFRGQCMMPGGVKPVPLMTILVVLGLGESRLLFGRAYCVGSILDLYPYATFAPLFPATCQPGTLRQVLLQPLRSTLK